MGDRTIAPPRALAFLRKIQSPVPVRSLCVGRKSTLRCLCGVVRKTLAPWRNRGPRVLPCSWPWGGILASWLFSLLEHTFNFSDCLIAAAVTCITALHIDSCTAVHSDI